MIYVIHWVKFTGVIVILAMILGAILGYNRARAGKVVHNINYFLKKWRAWAASPLVTLTVIALFDIYELFGWALSLPFGSNFVRGTLACMIVIVSFPLTWALTFFGLNFSYICVQYFTTQHMEKQTAAKAGAKVLHDHASRKAERIGAAHAEQMEQAALDALNGDTSTPA